jgi:hypothetical protein
MPISERPSAIVNIAPKVPLTNIGAMTRPKRAMPIVTPMSVRRRPRSARIAENGIVNAKNRIPTSCISRNCSRL